MRFGWLVVQLSCLSVVDSEKRKGKKIADKSNPFSCHKTRWLLDKQLVVCFFFLVANMNWCTY
jgi:hypothetical protein